MPSCEMQIADLHSVRHKPLGQVAFEQLFDERIPGVLDLFAERRFGAVPLQHAFQIDGGQNERAEVIELPHRRQHARVQLIGELVFKLNEA